MTYSLAALHGFQIIFYHYRIANRFGVAEVSFVRARKEIIKILVDDIYPRVVRWPNVDELPEVARKMSLNRK